MRDFIILNGSPFWANQRHHGASLAVAGYLQSHGISQSRITMINSDEQIWGPANPFPGTSFLAVSSEISDERRFEDQALRWETPITVRSPDVTVERISKLLGHGGQDLTVFSSGHGGVAFLKLEDVSDFQSETIRKALAFADWDKVLWVSDSCEIDSLAQDLESIRGLSSIASSRDDQKAWSHGKSPVLGTQLVDRWTGLFLELLLGEGLTGSAFGNRDICDNKLTMMEAHEILRDAARRPRSERDQEAVWRGDGGAELLKDNFTAEAFCVAQGGRTLRPVGEVKRNPPRPAVIPS